MARGTRATGSFFTPVKSNILCRVLNFHRIWPWRVSFFHWTPTILRYECEGCPEIIYKYDFEPFLKYLKSEIMQKMHKNEFSIFACYMTFALISPCCVCLGSFLEVSHQKWKIWGIIHVKLQAKRTKSMETRAKCVKQSKV